MWNYVTKCNFMFGMTSFGPQLSYTLHSFLKFWTREHPSSGMCCNFVTVGMASVSTGFIISSMRAVSMVTSWVAWSLLPFTLWFRICLSYIIDKSTYCSPHILLLLLPNTSSVRAWSRNQVAVHYVDEVAHGVDLVYSSRYEGGLLLQLDALS